MKRYKFFISFLLSLVILEGYWIFVWSYNQRSTKMLKMLGFLTTSGKENIQNGKDTIDENIWYKFCYNICFMKNKDKIILDIYKKKDILNILDKIKIDLLQQKRFELLVAKELAADQIKYLKRNKKSFNELSKIINLENINIPEEIDEKYSIMIIKLTVAFLLTLTDKNVENMKLLTDELTQNIDVTKPVELSDKEIINGILLLDSEAPCPVTKEQAEKLICYFDMYYRAIIDFQNHISILGKTLTSEDQKLLNSVKIQELEFSFSHKIQLLELAMSKLQL